MMPRDDSLQSSRSGGIHVGDVAGDISFSAVGDIVGGDKIVNVSATIQISVEAVTQRPLICESPYRGLKRFEDRERGLFFGREQLIKSLVGHIGRSHILLVMGPSGSGKSSVVRAGVLPALSAALGGRFRYFVCVPDLDPIESLRSSLHTAGIGQARTRGLVSALPAEMPALIRSLQGDGETWLFFVDQLEELFTVSEASVRQRFLDSIVALAQHPADTVKLVFAMRADFLDRFGPHPDLAQIFEKNISLVGDMHADELRLAIEQPAAQHGVVFENGLVEEILRDVQGQPGSLPLLQYALHMLWEEERRSNGLEDRHLNTRTYRELGGVRGALQRRADLIYGSFDDPTGPSQASEKQETVRRVFLRLVDIAGLNSGEAMWRPVRRRVQMDAFGAGGERQLLQTLIDEKLLVSSRDGAAATVEVAHEALFASWPKLRTWIEGGKQVIYVRNRLADDARRWDERRRHDPAGAEDELLTGTRLSQASEIEERGDFVTVAGGLSETELRYLAASREERVRRRRDEEDRRQRELAQVQALADEQKRRADEHARATARQRRLALAMVALSIVAVSAAVVGWHLQRQAEAARLIANSQLAEASWLVAQRARGDEYSEDRVSGTKAAHYLFRAAEVLEANSHGGPARNAVLAATLTAAPISATFVQGDLDSSPLAISPGGDFVLAWASDRTARLWSAMEGQPSRPILEIKGAIGALFSPDGNQLLTWSGVYPDPATGEASLWRTSDGSPMGVPMPHSDQILGATYSPDSSLILTWSRGGSMRVWHASDGSPRGESLRYDSAPSGPTTWMSLAGAVFSRDQKRLLTWTANESGEVLGTTVRVWDLESRQPQAPAFFVPGTVEASLLRKSEEWLVLYVKPPGRTEEPHALHLWTFPDARQLIPPMMHTTGILRAKFIRDGESLLTMCEDHVIRRWETNTGNLLGESAPHGEFSEHLEGPVASPDGRQVLTWISKGRSGKGQLWSWSVDHLRERSWPPLQFDRPVQKAAFSADSERIVTISGSSKVEAFGEARVWSAVDGLPLSGLLQHEDAILDAQFGADHCQLLTFCRDNVVRAWSIADRRPYFHPPKEVLTLRRTVLCSSGDRAVTWDLLESTIEVSAWDVRARTRLADPIPGLPMDSTRLGPCGRRVVMFADHLPIQLWNLDTGTQVATLGSAGETRQGARFDPTGRNIVTWDEGGILRVWNSDDGQPIAAPLVLESDIDGAILSPDRSQVLAWQKVDADSRAQLRRVADGKRVGAPFEIRGAVRDAVFSRDGRYVVLWSGEGFAQISGTDDSAGMHSRLEHLGDVAGVAFSGDAKRLIVWGDGTRARLWEVASMGPLGQPLQHVDTIRGAAFSADDQQILTWGDDGTVRLWSSENNQCIAVFTCSGAVTSACFSADGNYIVAADWRGDIWRWDVSLDETIPIAERVLEFEVRSATILGVDGEVRVLNPSEWEAKRVKLADMQRSRLRK